MAHAHTQPYYIQWLNNSGKRKKITLLSLTPNKIVQCDRAIAETAKHEYEIQHDQIPPP
jgi:hypothetical protein